MGREGERCWPFPFGGYRMALGLAHFGLSLVWTWAARGWALGFAGYWTWPNLGWTFVHAGLLFSNWEHAWDLQRLGSAWAAGGIRAWELWDVHAWRNVVMAAGSLHERVAAHAWDGSLLLVMWQHAWACLVELNGLAWLMAHPWCLLSLHKFYESFQHIFIWTDRKFVKSVLHNLSF